MAAPAAAPAAALPTQSYIQPAMMQNEYVAQTEQPATVGDLAAWLATASEVTSFYRAGPSGETARVLHGSPSSPHVPRSSLQGGTAGCGQLSMVHLGWCGHPRQHGL